MNRKLMGALGAIAVAVVAAFLGVDPQQLMRGELGGSAGQPQVTQARASGSGFDYYLLVLSWSPTWCEEENDDRSAQCNGKRDYGFVVHGLWPQFEQGYPEFCDVSARVEDRTVDQMLPIMPAKGLIYHQWKKHGTCSGLRPREYFETVRAAYDSIEIPGPLRKLSKPLVIAPGVIEDAFIEANPDLDANEIVVNCRRNRLREVKICLDADLTPRACSADVNRECRDKSVRMPPIR